MPEIGDTRPGGFRRIKNPNCGAKVEALLRRHGINYFPADGDGDCVAVPISLINRKRSQHLQARPENLVEDAVYRYKLSYKAAMEGKGEMPPPVILYKDTAASKLLNLAEGNNRTEAAFQAGLKEIPAFIISTNTPMEKVYSLMVEANAHHGVTPPITWRMQQALNIVALDTEGKIPLEEICRQAAISEKDFQLFRKVADFDRRAKPLKITGWQELHPKIRYKLGQIQSNRVLTNAAYCARVTDMNQTEAAAMVREIKNLHSESEQYDYVSELTAQRKAEIARRETEAANGSKRRIRHGVANSLAAGIGQVLAIDPGALAQITVTEEDRQTLLARLYKLGDHVLDLITALDNVVPQADEAAA